MSLVVLAATLSAAATAQEPTTKPEAKAASWTDLVKLSGKAFLRYSYELTESAGNANAFALDRMYLTGEFTPVSNLRFVLTLDAGDTRNSGSNQVFFAETKNAFVEAKEFLPGWYVRAGIISTAWIPYEEDLWGYRVQGPVAVDRLGYLTSADLGAGIGGSFGKLANFYATVTNGEGYKANELGKRKELGARLTVTPLASMGGIAGGLFASAGAIVGAYDDAGLADRSKSRYLFQVGLQSAALTLGAEYALLNDARSKVKHTVGTGAVASGNLLSFMAVIGVGELVKPAAGLELFGRLDLLDPDTTLANNDESVLIAGVGYKVNKNVKALLNYESQSYGADVGGVGTNKPADARVKLQAEVKF